MRNRGLATAGATLLAAFATAHLMQFGLSAGRAIGGESLAAPIGLATLVAWRAQTPAELPATPRPLHDPDVPALGPAPAERTARPDAAVAAAPRTNGLGLTCGRTIELAPLPDAMIRARIVAPCDPDVRVEVSHAGLRFAIATDAHGRAAVDLPALTTDATVEAAFADGTRLSARADVPEAARMDRVALVAEGWTGVTLRAGSVRVRGSPPSASPVDSLGDPGIGEPLLAQIYTAPAGRLGPLGGGPLRVEVALSAANCGRDVGAQIIRVSGGALSLPASLRLSVPACDAEGGVLVVDLTAPGLRLAGN